MTGAIRVLRAAREIQGSPVQEGQEEIQDLSARKVIRVPVAMRVHEDSQDLRVSRVSREYEEI